MLIEKQNPMKKLILILVLCLHALLGYTKDVNTLFNEFSGKSGVEEVHLNSFEMSLIKSFCGSGDDSEIIRAVKSVRVLDLNACSQEVKSRFLKKADQVKFPGYELLMEVKEEQEIVRIFLKRQDDFIRELVIVVTGEEASLIKITGKIKTGLVGDLVKKYK